VPRLKVASAAVSQPSLSGGGVEREESVLTEFVAGFLDRLADGTESVFDTVEAWCETSLVTDRSGKPGSSLPYLLNYLMIPKRAAKGIET
jgi:hypothetical protein